MQHLSISVSPYPFPGDFNGINLVVLKVHTILLKGVTQVSGSLLEEGQLVQATEESCQNRTSVS